MGKEKCLIKTEPPTLTNLVIVFHNNRERAQRATERFFFFRVFREVEKIH